jgi:hypothetical protein
MQWKVFCASATGKNHLDADEPCQDAVHRQALAEGFVGVVCDGAGSARHGQAGADLAVAAFARMLAEAVTGGALGAAAPEGRRAALADMLGAVRLQIEGAARAQEGTLRDFACTLVACAVWRSGGCFVHIGDGFALCVPPAGQTLLSPPENGEYADETYFLTDERWAEHLRVTELPALGPGALVGLMSDGVSPFAVNRARTGFYLPFIDPIVAHLRDAPEEVGNAALRNVLESERTFAITGDDKTLLLALAA